MLHVLFYLISFVLFMLNYHLGANSDWMPQPWNDALCVIAQAGMVCAILLSIAFQKADFRLSRYVLIICVFHLICNALVFIGACLIPDAFIMIFFGVLFGVISSHSMIFLDTGFLLAFFLLWLISVIFACIRRRQLSPAKAK